MAHGAALKLEVTAQLIEHSLAVLRRGGRIQEERVLLWLAEPAAGRVQVRELLVPEQEASSDYFRVPGTAVASLCRRLGETGYFVPCQVHSHPQAAFHSAADDRWALIRHVGALSLVLPYFARRTDTSTFVRDAVGFRLDSDDKWHEIDVADVVEVVR